jgi:hypothetical protein
MLCLSLAVAAPARPCITACLQRPSPGGAPYEPSSTSVRSWPCSKSATLLPTVPAHREPVVFQFYLLEEV